MSEAKKRTVQTDYEHPERKRRKPEEIQEIPDMSLQCAECGGNIADSKAGHKLAFCEDGTSLHLVMSLSNEGREGIGFRKAGVGFMLKKVPEKKKPSEKNPYASVSHVLCSNKRAAGNMCNKKIGGVKCYPPMSDNELIFFQHKALLVDNVSPKNWKAVRNSSLKNVQILPAPPGETKRQFKPRTWRPLVRHAVASGKTNANRHSGEGMGLTKTPPRPYQVELFRSVMESERNSLVYLPTGLGKTLVAAMVIKRLLELNEDKQAFFLVETNALAMQQTAQLQKECGGSVEMLVGSSLQAGMEGDLNRGLMKLVDVREARVVVSTAGAFEHAMCKSYIDPDSICCVVLDEAHHCGKEHPFNRVARSLLTTGGGSLSLSPPSKGSKGPSEYPKLVALTASPAGEKTVHETVLRIEGLLDRLGADLAAPVETLEEVKSRTPRVSLDLENVTANAPETALLGCLEKLVLSRVAKIVPANSDVAIQAKALLDGLEVRIKDAMAASKVTAAIGADVPRRDDSWRFPNKAYTALCQQALARCTTGLYHCAEKSERACPDGSGGGGDGGGAGNGGGGGGGGGGGRSDHTNLWKLMNLAFAVDEVGGEAIWRQVLEELEYQNTGCSGEEGDAAAPADDTRDPELEEAIDVIASYLGDHSSGDDSDAGSGAEAGAGGGRGARGGNVTGSKLDKMVRFLKDHKDACDRTRTPFSALLFVSTRDLALTTPEMLEGAPLISSFVKATAIVGLEEMTLKEQRTALTSFKDGPSNVLVSTSVCGEGIDVPACALVVCASLPNSGTALVQLRGRIRCEENCRFMGLTRNCGAADKEHVQSICLREVNMLEAIEKLSAGGGSNSGATVSSAATSRYAWEAPPEPSTAAAAAAAATAAPHANQSPPPTPSTGSISGAGASRVKRARTPEEALPGYPLFEIPAPAATCPEVPEMFRASNATGNPFDSPPIQPATVVPVKPPAERSKAAAGADEGFASLVSSERAGAGAEVREGFLVSGVGRTAPTLAIGGDNEWKKELPPRLKPEAENYAAMYLSTCVRQAMQKNPGQMARCIVNTATQLASKIKPFFEYEERKVGGPAHDTVFEARCFVSSRLEELAGLILVQEARAGSIKAAREGAAQKVVQYLLDKQAR